MLLSSFILLFRWFPQKQPMISKKAFATIGKVSHSLYPQDEQSHLYSSHREILKIKKMKTT